MLHKDKFEYIGTVGRAHGITGEVGLKLTVDIAPLREDGERLFLMLEHDGLLVPYAVESHRAKAGDIDLIRFAGIETKEQAEALTGLSVWLDADYIGENELSEDPHEWERYRGYTLVDADTEDPIGEIVDVDTSTLNSFISVRRASDEEELILPIAEELFADTDDDARVLRLYIPLGLLSDADSEYDIQD